LEIIATAGIMAIVGMLVGVLPLTMGIVYAIWPSEQRLALVRTLSVATIFAAVSGVALGFINELRFISGGGASSPQIAAGTAEALVTLFINFGCLTVTWLSVTVGLWRRP